MHSLSVTSVRKRSNKLTTSAASNQYLNLNREEREKVKAGRKMRYQYSCTPNSGTAYMSSFMVTIFITAMDVFLNIAVS
jgi:hypothetical protein